MYIKILLSYILGYVSIEVEGYFIEKFLNIAISKGIFLWNNKRQKSTILNTNVSIRDFRKIIKIAKKSKCKVKIIRKKGLPFIFNRYKKRKIFFISLCFILAIIAFLSNFIWNIQVQGNVNIPTEELIKNLESEGVKVGIFKNKINSKNIINKIRLIRDDLAWMGIEVKGTNLIVSVVEADKKPEIIQEDEFCNIIAIKDGIIVKTNATNGTPLVKEGDVIKKGTVLIGGWLEGKYTGMRYVHANGVVTAKVWYSQVEKVETKQTKILKTSNEEKRYSVKFNNFKINFYKTLSKFQNYDTIVSNKKIKLFSDFYLPIEFIETKNIEKIEETFEYTIEEAKNIAIESAKQKLNMQIEGKENNIVNTYINFNQDLNEVTVIYEVLEEIGTKEKIVF